MKDGALALLAANVWDDKGVALGGGITAFGKMGIMVQEEANHTLAIAISDPLQTQKNLAIEFAKPMKVLIDPQGKLRRVSSVKFEIDVSALKGQSYVFRAR